MPSSVQICKHSNFQNEYSSLTFLESYLECKRCGKAVLHSKISIEKHQEVINYNEHLCPFKGIIIRDHFCSKDQDCQAQAAKVKARALDGRNVDLLTLYRRSWGME